MDILFWTMGATFFVSLLGLAGAATYLLTEEQTKRIIYILTAFAVGTLLGGAFLHLLPEALGGLGADAAMMYALIGFFAFFVLEVYFHWHLCADGNCPERPYSYLLLIGDAAHNFIDGLVIAGGFLVGIPFGIITTVLIVAHELPEELGIFAILVHGGFDRRKAILSSFVVQCTALIGGLVGFYLSSALESFAAMLLAFAAGGFIYIAGSGLIPELHKETGRKKLASMGLILIGLIFMWAVKVVGGD